MCKWVKFRVEQTKWIAINLDNVLTVEATNSGGINIRTTNMNPNDTPIFVQIPFDQIVDLIGID